MRKNGRQLGNIKTLPVKGKKKLQQINEINATFIEMKFAVKTKLKRRNKEGKLSPGSVAGKKKKCANKSAESDS